MSVALYLASLWNRGLRQLGNGLKVATKQGSCIIKEFNSGTPIWQPWRHVKRLYSNFWVCTWNPMVWPFKWKLLNSNSTWYYLFFSILQNEIWTFLSHFDMATFGSEKVKPWYQLVYSPHCTPYIFPGTDEASKFVLKTFRTYLLDHFLYFHNL